MKQVARWYKRNATQWKYTGKTDTAPFVYMIEGRYYALRQGEEGPSVLPPFDTLEEAKKAALGKEVDDGS